MKFTTAWAAISAQNVTLRGAVGCLCLTTVGLGIADLKLSLKPPTIVERACFSRVLPAAAEKRTVGEIEAFIEEALSQRFDDSPASTGEFLSPDEARFRAQEQSDLKKKGMSQRVVIERPIKADGNIASVNAVRLISLGSIRSAFPFVLTVTFSETPRSDGNPYGLLVEKIVATKAVGPNETGK